MISISSISFAQYEGQTIRDAIKEAMEFEEYENAVKMYPHLFECDLGDEKYAYYYDFAFAQFNINNFDEATNLIFKALEIEKENLDYKWVKSSSYYLLSSISSKKGLINEKLKYLKRAVEYERDSGYLSTLGLLYLKLNKLDKALECLNEAIEVKIDNAYAYNNRALVYIKLREFKNAKTDIQKSIELDNKNSYAYKNEAILYYYQNEFTLACKSLNKAKKMGFSAVDIDTVKIEKHCGND